MVGGCRNNERQCFPPNESRGQGARCRPLAFSIAQRTQEIGVRLAIARLAWRVQALLLPEGVVHVFVGLTVEIAVVLWLAKYFTALVYGASATDPATFVGVGFVLAFSTPIAIFVPAYRAARMEPTISMR
jgi:ABC-type antimicrobial peptide transport system permease subunit